MIDSHTWPHYIASYGYLAVFLLSIVEGPFVTVFAAFLAAQGILDIFAIYGTVVTGDLVGDMLAYGVGRWFLARLPWRLGLRGRALRKYIAVLRINIKARAGHFLLAGKLTHSLGFTILLAAGAARVRLGIFILYNLLGTLPKSSILVVTGYFFGRFYEKISGQFQIVCIVALGLGMLMMMFLMHRIWAVNNHQNRLE